MQILVPMGAKPKYPSFAVIVVVVSPQGIPLVKERKEGRLSYYKIPGGKRDGEESPEECGIRETKEEIGVELEVSQLTLLTVEDRGTHDFFVFGVKLPELPKLKERGDEGEEIGVFSREGLRMRRDFFPRHKKIGSVIKFIYG